MFKNLSFTRKSLSIPNKPATGPVPTGSSNVQTGSLTASGGVSIAGNPSSAAGGPSSPSIGGVTGADFYSSVLDGTPRADLPFPASHVRRERRRSSVVKEERMSILRGDNPAFTKPLKDVQPAQKEAVFKQKLTLCSITEFNWDDADADRKAKDMKTQTLVELVEYIQTPVGQKIFTETTIGDVVCMVSANIFRPGPPPPPSPIPGGDEVAAGIASGGEEGDEEPYLDPAWTHLQMVYEFFLRFIVSAEVKAKTAKKWIDAGFCGRLVEQFDAEDPRERDYLKTILHRIYGKFMTHRGFIRKAIANVFYRFVYETESHHGIGELLEILGSVINGFALPLKPEHVQFLEKAIIPLHRPRTLARYYQQLCYCVAQYIEKDPSTLVIILAGILRGWPWTSSSKQIVYLNEIEEILGLSDAETIKPILKPLFTVLAKCVGCEHFQVAERALFLWNNEKLLNEGILSKAHVGIALPILFSSLQKQAAGHWNNTVEHLAKVVLKHYQDADRGLCDRCNISAASEPAEKSMAEAQRNAKWALIAEMAKTASNRR